MSEATGRLFPGPLESGGVQLGSAGLSGEDTLGVVLSPRLAEIQRHLGQNPPRLHDDHDRRRSAADAAGAGRGPERDHPGGEPGGAARREGEVPGSPRSARGSRAPSSSPRTRPGAGREDELLETQRTDASASIESDPPRVQIPGRLDPNRCRPLSFARQVTRDATAGRADNKRSLWSGTPVRPVGR